jgi:hypothetical protein
MDDDWKSMPGKQLRNRNAIRKIDPPELEARIVAENIEPGFLQPRIVICIEVVEPDSAMAELKQTLRHAEADNSRGARYQNCLIGHNPCVLTRPMS